MNFHGVYMSGRYLAVECKACNRRVAITKELDGGAPIYEGNMAYVWPWARRLKCQKCGSKEIRLYACTKDQAEMFLAGDPMPVGSEC